MLFNLSSDDAHVTIFVFGVGKIGSAVLKLLYRLKAERELTFNPLAAALGALGGQQAPRLSITAVDANPAVAERHGGLAWDLERLSVQDLTARLLEHRVDYVINCCPFFLNTKLAAAACAARCAYLDFTEDDEAAAAVTALYAAAEHGRPCAVKCGLAPGFVNYVGADLVRQLRVADPEVRVTHLKVRVGALPKHVAITELPTGASPDGYALSWSVDGLVNEYLRPCQVREDGVVKQVRPLDRRETIIIDGATYEARSTSGGVGSLITDHPEIPNVDYKTIRYPGHFDYVERMIVKLGADFNALRAQFLRDFAWTDDDVVVVFAQALGVGGDGLRRVKTFARRFGGVDGLTAIQTTTAGGGVAVLELLLTEQLRLAPGANIVTHAKVSLEQLAKTTAYQLTYGAGAG
jgi:saccharopine dehydrogenase-like NADP-dependent oxidoreductase